MAIISCAECGKPVSTVAKSCPNCGAPPKRQSLWGWIGWGALVAIVVVIWGRGTNPNRTSSVTPPDPQREERLKIATGAVIALKKAVRDPDSLVIESVFTDAKGGRGCIAYRSRNGFGGMNRAILTWDQKGFHEDAATNASICAATSYDESYARQALK
jgi:hypothetical protein